MSTLAQRRASAERRAMNRQRGEARSHGHGRVRARPICAGRSYKVTKRCDSGSFHLAPGEHPEVMVGLVGYCLAYCAQRFEIEVHGAVFMSNHYHLDVTDPFGNLVDFKQTLNSLLARALNAKRGRFGGVWEREKACDTRRVSEDESFGDLVYTLVNPVKDGLVRRSHSWPGFTTAGWRFGDGRSFRRPSWFFSKRMPGVMTLSLVRPRIRSELSDGELFAEIEAELRRREKAVEAKFRRENRRFVGVVKLRRVRWDRTPSSFEERFKVTPTVATACPWKRLAQLQRDREWERQYAQARERLLAGADAVFPAGTFKLRRLAGVAVAAQDSS